MNIPRLPVWSCLGFFLLGCLASAARAAAAEPPVIPIWPGVPPGSEGKNAPEKVRLYENREHIVSSVHRPSLTVFLPETPAPEHIAVVVIPGGGHRELWMDHEGYAVAQALNQRGIAAFVLKYRLTREEGSTYSVEQHALADAQRAIRLIRSRAKEFSIDPSRVGVIGFSAGGEMAALAASRVLAANPGASDPVERESSRPAFQGLVYPGNAEAIAPTKGAPPAFLLAGDEDTLVPAAGVVAAYTRFHAAGVSAELHVLAHAGHGFGLRPSNHGATADWINGFVDWLSMP
jgi:endo-1,4-beta-xylanase